MRARTGNCFARIPKQSEKCQLLALHHLNFCLFTCCTPQYIISFIFSRISTRVPPTRLSFSATCRCDEKQTNRQRERERERERDGRTNDKMTSKINKVLINVMLFHWICVYPIDREANFSLVAAVSYVPGKSLSGEHQFRWLLFCGGKTFAAL